MGVFRSKWCQKRAFGGLYSHPEARFFFFHVQKVTYFFEMATMQPFQKSLGVSGFEPEKAVNIPLTSMILSNFLRSKDFLKRQVQQDLNSKIDLAYLLAQIYGVGLEELV